jgi:hypothetical protein
MSNARVTKAEAPAVIATRNAPKGPPLTDEERARIEAARRDNGIPHADIMRQLEERKRRGE